LLLARGEGKRNQKTAPEEKRPKHEGKVQKPKKAVAQKPAQKKEAVKPKEHSPKPVEKTKPPEPKKDESEVVKQLQKHKEKVGETKDNPGSGQRKSS